LHRISRIATLGAPDGGNTGEDKERARNESVRAEERKGRVKEGVRNLRHCFVCLQDRVDSTSDPRIDTEKTTARKLSVLSHFIQHTNQRTTLIDQLVCMVVIKILVDKARDTLAHVKRDRDRFNFASREE